MLFIFGIDNHLHILLTKWVKSLQALVATKLNFPFDLFNDTKILFIIIDVLTNWFLWAIALRLVIIQELLQRRLLFISLAVRMSPFDFLALLYYHFQILLDFRYVSGHLLLELRSELLYSNGIKILLALFLFLLVVFIFFHSELLFAICFIVFSPSLIWSVPSWTKFSSICCSTIGEIELEGNF